MIKNKLLVIFCLLVFQLGFSQTEKLIQGKILCENLLLQGIEVLNLASKSTTITDTNGRFSILAKAKDTLMFISKNYEYKRLFLEKEDVNKSNLIILLIRKPEQLEEVVIRKISLQKIKFDKNIASQLNIEKTASRSINRDVYDGSIENGIGMIINLSSSRKKIHQIEFKELVKKTNDENYYLEILKLKPDEFGLFIEFCDADPKSKTILKNTNPLSLMDFLLTKNVEFKKLPTIEK